MAKEEGSRVKANRYPFLLKLVCAALALLVLYQAAGVARKKNPLKNVAASAAVIMRSATNAESANATNAPGRVAAATNRTNSAASVALSNQASSVQATTTNQSTNAVRSTAAASRAASRPRPPGGAPAQKNADLPGPIQARIDRITQSEILGVVVRPLPMALLGIAGKNVFFRAPNGQAGLLTEGEELGGVKLLRIGTNRVLIEQDGEQKELTVFAGLGGESLAPVGKEKPQ